MVHSLLFIENRDLLDPKQPLNNPAVDWPRFAMAAYSQVAKLFHLPGQSAGEAPWQPSLRNIGTHLMV